VRLPRLPTTFSDMRRMIEGIGISRRIGRDAAFAKLVEMEMTPGASVTDDDTVKRAIVEQVDVYAHPPRLSRWGWKDPAWWARSGLRCAWPHGGGRIDHAVRPQCADKPHHDHDRRARRALLLLAQA